MAFTACRRCFMALLAWVSMVLWAAAPLQAEDSRILLETLKASSLENGGGVSYARYADAEVYLMHGREAGLPEVIILVPSDKGALEELGRRFVRAYRLQGYKARAVRDGSALLLMRQGRSQRWSYRGQQALLALTNEHSLVPTLEWLNAACGGAPARMKGSKLYWKRNAAVANKERELEVVLDLCQGAPCYVDINLRVPVSAAADTMSENLRMRLEESAGSKLSSLRRRIGTKPLGYMSDAISQGGEAREVNICLIKPESEKVDFRLGESNTLRKLDGRSRRRSNLPEVELSEWVDEMSNPPALPSDRASEEKASQPDAGQAADNEGGEAPGREEDSQGKGAVEMSPAEARKAWSERLNAL